jgi:hypothetical protein
MCLYGAALGVKGVKVVCIDYHFTGSILTNTCKPLDSAFYCRICYMNGCSLDVLPSSWLLIPYIAYGLIIAMSPTGS